MEDQTINKPVAAKAVKEKYVINDRFLHMPHLITLNKKGKRINLLGRDVTIKRDPTPDDARTEVFAKGATQEELADHYNAGTQYIVEIE